VSQPPIDATSLGRAVPRLLSSASNPISGVVVGVFSRGCYVRFVETLIAVGDIPAGPLHVCCRLNLTNLATGTSATLSAALLTVGDQTIDLGTTPVWNPTLPNEERVPTALSHLARLPDDCPDDLVSSWTRVVAAVSTGSLRDAAQLLGGRGGGTTPTGDDVLAGLLLIDALCFQTEEGQYFRRAVAVNVPTTDLSRHFLAWAACGQSIGPVHEVIDQAAAGSREEVVEAAARVRAIGASSGRAILAGLRLGALSRVNGSASNDVQT
jgi:Protein of unknown function (DUF2877)